MLETKYTIHYYTRKNGLRQIFIYVDGVRISKKKDVNKIYDYLSNIWTYGVINKKGRRKHNECISWKWNNIYLISFPRLKTKNGFTDKYKLIDWNAINRL